MDIFISAFPGAKPLFPFAVGDIEERYTTFYGVSRIVNEALGTSLPEHRGDVGNTCAHLFVFWASLIPFIPAGWFSVFLIVMVFKGSAVGALLAMPASMAADAVDIDSARPGQQRAGLYFSVWGMSKKGGTALGGAIALAAVQFFGFDPQANPSLSGTNLGNSENALVWLALLYAIIPAALKIMALPFIWRYPLTEERLVRIRARIERRGIALKAGTGDAPHQA